MRFPTRTTFLSATHAGNLSRHRSLRAVVWSSLVIMLGILSASVAFGQTWDGGGTSINWTTANNWNPNVLPVNNGTANLTFTGNTRPTVNMDYPFSVNRIIFDANSASFILQGQPLTIQGGGILSDALVAERIDSAVVLGANQTWMINDANSSLTSNGIVSGTGSLEKAGNGTLVLSGNNTYSGGTTVSAGTLQGTTTSLKGNITNNARVTFNQGTTGTYSGAMTGNGSAVKSGTGTVTLSGNNAYSGGTTVSGGTLSGTTTSLQGDITNNAKVTFNQSTNGTYSGAMTGTGAVVKNGAGTVTLSGSNSYSGGTTVSAGTLEVGANGALPTGQAVTVSGGTLNLNGYSQTTSSLAGTGGTTALGSGTLTVDGSNSTSYAGAVEGTGSLAKAGSSTLTLSGTNTYSGGTTVSGGSLSGTTAGIQGAINNNANVTFNQTSNGTYSGAMTGSGTLSKTGTGTVTLSGNNNYSGGTTVSAGTLQGTTTSLQGNVTNNANVNFNQTTTGTYSGTMSGTGSLTKSGTGSVTLSGANVHSGGTVVSAGTLQVGASGALPTGQALTVNGGTLDLNGFNHSASTLAGSGGTITLGAGSLTVNSSSSTSYAGAIQGNGALVKSGSGTQTLTGNNTYSGGTTVSGGTLAGTTDSLQGDIVNNGTVTYSQGTAGEYSGEMTGSGAVVKSGTGEVTFSGANTYSGGTTVSGGSLIGNTASLQGAIDNNGQVTFDQAADGTYAGAMTGSGDLKKNGAGAVQLSGTNTYSGNTSVDAGALIVNGSITSDTSVANGARLAGTGSIQGDVTNSGTVAAGNSIGTMTVNGGFTHAAGGTLEVEINAGGTTPGVHCDLLQVDQATLNGGTVVVVAAPGAYTKGAQYTFLTANTVTGTFTTIVDDLAFYDAVLGYTPGSAYFTLLSTNQYVDFADTPNTYNLATYLDQISNTASGDLASLLAQLDQVSDADAGLALEQMTGAIHGSMAQIGVQNTTIYLQALANRFRGGMLTGDDPIAAAAADDAPWLVSSTRDQPLVIRGQAPRSEWATWATGFGLGGNVNSDGNAAALRSSVGGVLTGAEAGSDDVRLGLYGGYLANEVSTDAHESARVNGGTFGGYLAGRGGPHYFFATGGFEFDDYETTRRLAFANSTASGGTTAWKGFSYVESGARLGSRGLCLQPFSALQYIYLRQNGFSETGGAGANLELPGLDTHSLRGGLGTRIAADAPVALGYSIVPELRALWLHEFLETSSGFDTFLPNAGGGFSVNGLGMGRDWAVLGCGLNSNLAANWSSYANYDLMLNDQTTFHIGSGGVRYSW